MNRPLNVAINGASGRMGKALLGLFAEDTRFDLVHAVVPAGRPQVGTLVFAGTDKPLRFSPDWRDVPAIDVVIDFSTPVGLAAALDFCVAQGVALVSGTTGLDAALEVRMLNAGASIPILRAANFSLGVAVLQRLLRQAASALPDWDLEIVEAHHGRKQDAPSGTALALGHAAAAARGTSLELAAVYSREGQTGERKQGSIGFAVVRGGDIVGEHDALLIGQGERLELSHRATDRSIFARGALHASLWLSRQAPGLWQIDDVIAGKA